MSVSTQTRPFGSLSRTRILLALRLLGESYARELTRVCGTQLSSTQRALRTLEKDGLVSGRTVGKVRIFTLNPAFPALAELRPLLLRLAELDRPLQREVVALRRRPRLTGKPA